MSHYKSNLRDIEFNLFEVLGRQEILGSGPFEEVDESTARSALDEVERLAVEEHVLLLDAERVGIGLSEGVVEHAPALNGALAGDRVGIDLLHGSTASASISKLTRMLL